MTRVAVSPALLDWACARSQRDPDELGARFPQLEAWRRGDRLPTVHQLEDFARATRTPFGYLFLPQPPEEPLPITDLRSLGTVPARPSPDLLDTIYAMQRRQDWLREERSEGGVEPVDFVGSARLGDDPVAVGRTMRRRLGLDEGWAAATRTWAEAVGELRRRIEALGVVAVINGVVGNNTARKLNVSEFRGFALPDPLAPLIFVNGADSRSAQMFTLAHELAHLWLGREGEGLSGFDGIFPGDQRVERFCDQAAAEFLVPAAALRAEWAGLTDATSPFEQLARRFKVSPIVVGRRAMELGLITRAAFFDFYRATTAREAAAPKAAGGGDFYRTQSARLGDRFAASVMWAALAGRLSFKEAYALTDLRGGAFQEYGRRIGVPFP